MNLPYWTLALVPPLLALAIALNLGWFDPLITRALDGRRRADAEAVDFHEWLSLLQLAEGAAWDYSHHPVTGPLPAAMQDTDPDYPWLAAGQYGDWTTGSFAAITAEVVAAP